eukprot:TRINITY_DN2842_c0_g1_i1.p1 TRINITY_DN2842_c0_g1~~TRINITY_DN2842_c0_g1_i1.p1  ORF type:complete len:1131 (+),score=314.29 TRINITY_DN2842_c0_g1_i1:215-3607(+)
MKRFGNILFFSLCGLLIFVHSARSDSTLDSSAPPDRIANVFSFFDERLLDFVQTNLQKPNCDLSCWLNYTFTIPIPPLYYFPFNISITELNCSQSQIGNISSQFVYPLEFDAKFTGVGTTCNGNVQVYIPLFGWQPGTATILVTNSSIDAGIGLNKTSEGYANAAYVSKCDTKLQANFNIQGKNGNIIMDAIGGIIDVFTKQIVDTLDDLVCSQLTVAVNNNLTDVLQDVNQYIKTYENPQPPNPTKPVPEGMVDLVNNPIAMSITSTLDDVVSSTGLFSINMIMNKLTNSTGHVTVPDSLLEMAVFTVPIPSLGNITIGITNLSLGGINTWGDITTSASGNYSLSVHTQLEQLLINATFFVNVTTVVNQQSLFEEGTLQIVLSQNNMNATSQIALDQRILDSLQVSQYQYVGCLLPILYDVEISQIYFNMSVDQLAISAFGGSLETYLDEAISNLLLLFTTSFKEAIPAFVNGFTVQPAILLINQKLESLMNKTTTNTTCPEATPPARTWSPLGTTVAFSSTGGMFALCSIFVIIVGFAYRKKQLDDQEDAEDYGHRGVEVSEDLQPSLAMNPRISWVARFGLPLLIFANIGLFISSNTSVGASIYMMITLGADTQIMTPSLFSFSLVNTIHDMWDAKVYYLASLIAAFSGFWPYSKLLMMLFCWYLPGRFLKPTRRETMLMVLDTLGKWSLIDAFVLILMAVAFRFHIVYPLEDSEFSPVIDVFVHADWGFYSFLLATMTSLVFTHLILGYHHHVMQKPAGNVHRKDLPSINYPQPSKTAVVYDSRTNTYHHDHESARLLPDNPEKEKKRSLRHHIFEMEDGSFFQCSPFGQCVVVIMLLGSFAVLLGGFFDTTFSFVFKGFAAYAMEVLGAGTERYYSLVSLGLEVPYSAQYPNAFGIRWIQGTYFLFTIAIPPLHLTSLLILWLIPLTKRAQRRFFVVTEIFNAWSAIEVFVIAIIAAVLQIEKFAQFIVGDHCDLFVPYLKEYFSEELDGDLRCFDVVATLAEGCWLLFCAAVIYLLSAFIVMKMCHNAVEQSGESHKLTESDGFTNVSVKQDRKSSWEEGKIYGRLYRSQEEVENKKLRSTDSSLFMDGQPVKKKSRKCSCFGMLMKFGIKLRLLREVSPTEFL